MNVLEMCVWWYGIDERILAMKDNINLVLSGLFGVRSATHVSTCRVENHCIYMATSSVIFRTYSVLWHPASLVLAKVKYWNSFQDLGVSCR